MPQTIWEQHGSATLRRIRLQPGERMIGTFSTDNQPEQTRSEVTRYSSDSKRRAALGLSRWLAGRQDVATLTLTLGRDYGAIDPVGAWKAMAVWLKRQGWSGYWFREQQRRGASHWHLYLDLDGDGLAGDWQAATGPVLRHWVQGPAAATGATLKGQDAQLLRSYDAAVAYMVAHVSKAYQQGTFKGRRWGRIDSKRVEVDSVPVRTLDGPAGTLWGGWLRVALDAVPFSAAALVRTLAGWCPRWYVGPLPVDPLPVGLLQPDGLMLDVWVPRHPAGRDAGQRPYRGWGETSAAFGAEDPDPVGGFQFAPGSGDRRWRKGEELARTAVLLRVDDSHLVIGDRAFRLDGDEAEYRMHGAATDRLVARVAEAIDGRTRQVVWPVDLELPKPRVTRDLEYRGTRAPRGHLT